ncbi:amino acid adenylation domain-containing protein [Xenorhabdus nematophila]|uniref:non-ribosomal peptide synthetase n=1 Tax=Xenorhabdus nematophila TaxID=628 RepID=UPI001D81B452|nr:non-ribosomal peptide synthetase [Xenorhabdus nematophila]MCB4424428.1 amino acid adenylation domain-containing protein [Xenorhabdus nematophila]
MDLDNLKRAVLKKKIKEQLQARKHQKRPPIKPVARDRPLPLSFAQQRLWFLNQLDPAASLAYHLPVALRLIGQLNHQALTQTLNHLVARHESLRTRFRLTEDQPCQYIDPADIGFTLSNEDLRQLDAEARIQRMTELTALEAKTPFNLTQGPLIRGQLLQLTDEEHVLLLSQHHIISDGWSIGVLVHELGALYQAAFHGHDNPLPPMPIQYADYAVWQREWLQGNALTQQRDFWCTQLEGAPALLDLPTDRPRPSVQTYAGSQIPVEFDTTLLNALKSLGQRHNTTLFMTVLAAWSIVLARLSGQDDIVIGAPVANRPHRELEGLIGFFINTLALRVTLDNTPRVADLLTHIRERALSAYAHQDLPFEQVVEALQPERSLSYSPIFQVMLAFNNTPAKTLTLPGLQLAPAEQMRHSTHFDMTLSLTETDAGLFGELEYAVDLFDSATIKRTVSYLKQVLIEMIKDETQLIANLTMLPDAERQQLLVEFNATASDFPQDALIHQLFEAQAAKTPDATAIVYGEQSLSYGELNRRANRLAHYLIAQGVRPDARVAVCTERNPRMVIGLLAILKAGGAYVPLDPAYPAERLAYMLDDAAPVTLLTQTDWVDKLSSALPTILLDNDELLLAAQPTDNPNPQRLGLTPHHLAYVIYTSGSTGQPKGVMIEHQSLCNLMTTQQNTLALTADSRVLQFASNSFDACIWECCMAFQSGGSLYLAKRADILPGAVLSGYLRDNLISHVLLSPTALAAMDSLPDTLHTLLVGGEACPATLVKRWSQGRRMLNAYGPTEITVCATIYSCAPYSDDRTEDNPPPIGRPIANTQIYILDAHAQPVPRGVIGEIYIAGAGVARGYLNRPALTAERFLTDPFSTNSDARMYKTGDLGRWLSDGNIEYLGRNDFQVKLRGFRIEPGEIEARLKQCHGVREAVVLAREVLAYNDMTGQKRLVAYLLPQAGVELEPAELRQQLTQYLADYMLPSAFVTLESFPLTPNGKLDRQALPDPDASALVVHRYEAPSGETEIALAEIWQNLLGLEHVGRHDHFFELGGHSLLAVRLVVRIRQTLARELSLQQLFARPVLMQLAHTLTDSATTTHAIIPVADRSQPLPLSFAQQRLWFLGQLDPAASQAYHLPAALRLSGSLDHHALTVALDRLVARHESLRTRFVLVGGQPCQHIDPADIGFTLSFHDFCQLDPELHTQRVAEFAEQEAQIPFDFTQGPLIRGQLLQLADEEHVLLLTMHHIITDGWSIGVLVRELGAFYRAALNDDDDPLPPLSIQYADYAVWQHDMLQSASLTEQRDFWCSQLDGIPALLTLPTDRPRPALQSYVGDHVPFHLDAPLLASLKTLGQRHNSTLFMTVLTAWSIVLSRLSGQDDIVIGTPVANRPHHELEELIGFFVNTLALRVTFNHDLSVAELIAQVRERALAAYDHQDLPFEQVVEALQPERNLSYSPVFQVMLALNNTPAQALTLPGLQLKPCEQSQHKTHFDLTLSLTETETGLAGALAYAADLFDTTTIERMVGYLTNILTAMTDDETQTIAALPMLTETERQQLLVEFNATASDFPQDALIHQLFEAQAAKTPDATAIVYGEQSLSYAELNQRANRLAHHLMAQGVRPDDRVAICVERNLETIAGLLGILKAGGAYVSLDPAYPSERLAYILEDAAPVAIVTQKTLADKLSGSVPAVFIEDILNDPKFTRTRSCTGTLSFTGTQSSDNPDAQVLGLTSSHLAYVIYTSGSTGLPKGVAIAHRNTVNFLTWAKRTFSPEELNQTLFTTSLNFDLAVYECFTPLISGGTVHIIPDALSLITTEHSATKYVSTKQAATLINTVPSAIAHLIEANAIPAEIQTVNLAGEALKPHIVEHLFSRSAVQNVCNLYGPSETTTYSTWTRMNRETGFVSHIGRPIANTRIYILDAQQQPVPIGVAGEIYIAGSGVARGYLNRPELTAERFLIDPFCSDLNARMYKTGDLGRWLPDGNIEYLGRNDFQVKLRGFRIELGEIEIQLMKCEGVREAVVIVREDLAYQNIAGQKRLVAYLRPQDGVELIPAELRRKLAQHLAEYMLPSAFVMLNAFPLTPNGKLDRQALPAPDSSAVVARGYEAPIGEVETALVQIWQDLLKLEQVGRYDHFFELGGHSLMIVNLIEQLHNFGWRLDVRSVFATPVLNELAQSILASQNDTRDFVVPPNLIPADCTEITPEMLPLVSLSQDEINAITDTIPGGVSNVQDIYPLAPLQKGILFQHLLQTQGDDYLLQSMLAFDTRERLDAFLNALQTVINRHDILRTSAYWQDLAEPVQVVWRQATLSANLFTPATTDDVTSQLRAHTDPRRHRLNLGHAPLFATDFAHDPIQNEWLLSLRFHHLVSDHMTLELIFAEIALVLQRNKLKHDPLQEQAEILPSALPYRNFIAQTLSMPMTAHEDYFRARFADIDEPTAPFGILKVQSDHSAINEARRPIEPELAKAIRSQARRLGISPSVLFHVALAQVLAHTSGHDDVVFGSVLLGRLQGISGAGRILGMFINTLPMRISLNEHSALEVVKATYRNLTELLEHEQAPLSLAQQCSGVAQPTPLFSVLLNYRHNHVNESDAVNAAWAGMRVLAAEERTNYPISLSVDDSGTDFHLMAQTVDSLDPARIINYLVTAIRGLIETLIHHPQQPILQVPVLPAAEQQQLLVDFNTTQVDFPQNALIHQLFETEAARHPADIAIVCRSTVCRDTVYSDTVHENQSLSYDELNRRANRLAHYLITLGVRPDDRVAMCVERSLEMVIGLLAILKAGGAYVPLDPAYPAERLFYMLEDSAPVVLLTQTASDNIFTHTDPLLIPTVILDAQTSLMETQPDHNPEVSALTAHHLAYVVYTSGSTGLPKGVMNSHQALCNRLLWFVRDILTHPLVAALKTSISFVDSVTETLGTLLSGGKLVVFNDHEVKDLVRFSEGLQRFDVNYLVVVPSLLKLLIQNHGESLKSIRTLICSGEKLAPELAREVVTHCPWLRLLNFYGSSEVTGDATWYEYSAEHGVPEAAVIGRPIANIQSYILDSHGRPVPLGVTGEIYIAGNGVARGYLNRPELTAERFLADPFSAHPDARMYKTGDLGRWLPDGNIEYLGRNDFQVKLRGFRIELGEIEARLAGYHGVREAVVLAREDEPGQKRLVAYLRPQEGFELKPAELRQELAQHLADYMLPSAFVTLDAFPLTPSGKLNRQAFPAPDSSSVIAQRYEAPVGETETALAQIWQTLLGLERIGRHDHFFELGGHSLLAVQLVARIRQSLARELPLHKIFTQPVLMMLAHTLGEIAKTTQTVIPTTDRSQPLPLSFAQQRLWFLGQLDPSASQAYHLPAALRLTGSLNHHALTFALDSLVARHESLRTRFVSIEGQPFQHIDPADCKFSLSCQDLRQLSPELHNQRVAELAALEARTRFDFAQGPLIRGQLLQLADEEHVLLLTMHHIITDGWSIGVLVRELGVFYRAALNGENEPLPSLPIQYADYAVWQRDQRQEATLKSQRDFWCTLLEDIPALLTLPTDRPRPSVQTYIGGQVPFCFDAPLLASLKKLGQRHNTTLFMTVLSAWSIVLARFSGQDDIVIGTPVANRPHQELEGLIGFFVNTLALRVRFSDNPSVAELLAQVREQALAAYAHQDLPFEQVVEALQPERSLSYSPIFQVMMTLNNTSAQQLVLPGLQLSSIEQVHYGALFDLTLSLTETESALVGALSYAANLFDSATIERLIGYLKNILTAMSTDETQSVAALPILPDSERQKLLINFNATEANYPEDTFIHPLFEIQAAQNPNAPAVVLGDQSLSYAELNLRASRLAHYLIALGVRPDERVAICVERSFDMVVGLLAILKAGGAYVPLDPAYPAERLAYMLGDAKPVALLTQSALADRLNNAIPSAGHITVVLDTVEQTQILMKQPAFNPDPHALGLASHHLAYVIYTSGSTGLPKGVEMPLAVLSNLLLWHRHATSQPSGAGKTLQFAALGFDVAFQETFTTLCEGGCLVLINETVRREPHQLLRLIEQEQIDRLFLPYIALQQLAEAASDGQEDIACLAHIVTAGEQLRITPAIQHLLQRAGNCRLHNHYGPSESHVATAYILDKQREQWPLFPPIGRPIANARIYILDGYGQPAPLGVAGEIYIAGTGVARGYLNRPALTAERFRPDPFSANPLARMYKTGDLGRWLPDGNIEYLGRNDFQVKIRGFRIELGEIEAKLMDCRGVREAVVIAREDEPGQKRLVAYLRPLDGAELVPAELREQLSRHLADAMLPGAFVTLETFPLTPNGKLDRQSLPVPDASSVAMRCYAAPVGETEIVLAQIWQTLLGLERVGRHDHFFELGGHSLLAVRLVVRIRQTLARELSLQQLFAQPVLMQLAHTLTDSATTTHAIIPVADRSQPLPLSFAQQRLWFLGQLDPAASQAYHLPAALRLSGSLDHHALTVALDRLVARHESLRTRFVLVGGQPCQHIDPADIGFTLSFHDFCQLDPELHTQRVAEFAEQEAQIPFDFTQGPLIRGQLLQLADEEHVLLLTMHHIITDGWSLGVLVRELGAFYRAALNDDDDPLPPLSIQYADYAVWQHDMLQSASLTEQRDFWCSQLDGIPALLTLPTDRPRPALQSYVGDHVPFHLDAPLLASLKTLGQRHNSTLFMTVLTAWSIVLSRLSGQDDIVIGTPVANRPHHELEELIGFFVNTLALRVTFNHDLSVAELIAQVRERALAAYDHQDLPFEQVVEALQPERNLSYSPVFQVMLALNNTPAQALTLPGLQLKPCEQSQHKTHFDLTLSLTETETGLAGALAYAADLFDTTTIERMVGYLTNILTAMTDDETQTIAALPMLTETERQQLLVEFNATASDFPQDALIHQLFEAQAAKTPDATAIVYGEQSLSYGELNQRANHLAHHLMTQGVRPDDRIAICVERSLDSVVGLLAILKAGGAYVPLDTDYPTERLAYMLEDAAPVVLLTQTSQLDKLSGTLPVVILDTQNALLESQSIHNPETQMQGLTSRHLAYVIYTSGSTGQPKGVMVEHRNVLRLIINNGFADIGPDDCIAHCANMAFDASTWEIWSALLNGGCLHVVSQPVLLDPVRFCDSLIRGKVTGLWLTAGLFNEYLDTLKPVFRQLRYLLIGGDVLDPNKIQQVQLAESKPTYLINGYGPTETTTFAATYTIPSSVDVARSIPIGCPIANTQIYILDSQGRPVPVGVAGEIYIAGNGVARGYLNRPELTAERFLADPFSQDTDAHMYKTGDLGRWLADGNIEYLGRNDFQVKLRGFRIEPGEIEARLKQCHGVREAVVLAREVLAYNDMAGQKRLVAYLLPQAGVELVPAELRQQLTQYLADYMLPSAFVTLESLPLTPNGKLDRQALPDPDASALVVHRYEAPSGETEIALAEIWQNLLGLEHVGRHDHFFELGGHSLLAVKLLNLMREKNMEVPLTALFAHPTLCHLASIVGEQLIVPASPFDENPVPLKPAGALLPLFLIHEASGDPLVYSPLAALLPPELPVYALQALGIHTIEHPPVSIEALAASHIQAIRRIQPQGPYRLAGWSIGGLIAYEMAQQLITGGEAVEFLGMIDAYIDSDNNYPDNNAPNHHAGKDHDEPSKTGPVADKEAQRIASFIDSLRTQENINDEQALEELHTFSQLEQIIDYCIDHQWFPTGITREDILLRLYSAEMITQLGQNYIAPKSSLPVHLYVADDHNGDVWRGWRDIIGQNSELHLIGGTHFSIMSRPLLNHLADSMIEHLNAVPAFDPRVIIQQGSQFVPPLFCLPGAGASPSSLLELTLAFPRQLPIYALQARGFTAEHNVPYSSVEGAARAYIRIIRQTQPRGPYHLLGHSFGGWIAFEMALQLQAEGETVSDLILIDTDEPNQPGSIIKSFNSIETIMELIDIYNMILDQPLPLTRQDFDPLSPDEQTQYLHNSLVKAGLFPAKTPVSLLQGIIRVMQANLNTGYQPRTRYKGLVHLVNAEQGDTDERKTREHQWNNHVAQLNTILTPGNHMTMLSTPQIEQWLPKLWQELSYMNNPLLNNGL